MAIANATRDLHLVGKIGAAGFPSGTANYEKLSNKPSINGVILIGNLTTEELGIPKPTINGVEIGADTMMEDLIDPTEGLGLKINGVPITGETTLEDLGDAPIPTSVIDDVINEVFGE